MTGIAETTRVKITIDGREILAVCDIYHIAIC
jgi:hypothetical protein